MRASVLQKLSMIIFSCLFINNVWSQDLNKFDSQKGLSVNGSVGASMIAYTASEIESRRDPFDYYLTGNVNIGLFGYSLPFSFNYSNRKTNYTQPFNNFKFSPSYKWIKTHIGTSSMSFSPYTLGGHQFTGVGVELTPGKWEVAAMYGKLKSAVEPDYDNPEVGEPSFKRTGYGLKVAYNDNGNSYGINVFRAHDHEKSLQFVPLESDLRAMENTAIGVSIRQKIYKGLSFDAEYSFSLMQQRSNPRVGEQSEENSDKLTQRYFDAMNFGIGYQAKWYGIQLRYERVAPNYESLGAYYFTNDMQNITIAPSLRIWQGKLNIAGNLGFQNDNLDGQKASKTKRFVGTANANYVPNGKWNFSASYSNFNTYTKHRLQEDPYFKDELDSLNFYQVNQSLNLNTAYNFGGEKNPQNIMLGLAYQKANQEQKSNPDLAGSDIYNVNVTYAYNFAPQSLSLAFSANYNNSNAGDFKSTYIGPSLNITKGWFKNLLKNSLNVTYSNNKSEGQDSENKSSTMNSRLGFNFNPKSEKNGNHNLGLNLNYLKSFVSTGGASNYSEFTTTLNYTYSF